MELVKTCSVKTCSAPVSSRGWCRSHYSRWKRHGDVQADTPLRAITPGAACVLCGKPVLARGWCATHYQRWHTTGDPGPAELLRVPSDPNATQKRCTLCGETKPIGEFYTDKRTADGRGSHCKSCFGPRNATRRRKRIYGLAAEDYDALVADQGGACAICREVAKLVVDHCHRKGHVRALLCDRCNRLLGVADDNVELLRAAIKYLT